MELPATAHTDRPWRIHAVAPDFGVEDVWALPTPGGPADFGRLMDAFARTKPTDGAPPAVQLLWAVRMALGRLLRLDGRPGDASTLRDRLPEDLRAAPRGPGSASLPFSPLYLIGDEWATEIVNQTMHGVLHLGWVEDGAGGWRGQMAVLVKPNGRFGEAYMAAIRPFRRHVIYPSLLQRLGNDWATRAPVAQPA